MIQKARNLRKNQTDAEKLLWQQLRSRQLDGHKFRRQYPVGKYIVDFVCVAKMLIVEVDGGQHAELAEGDEARTEILNSKGYKVIRFWNNEVLSEKDAVLEKIYEELKRG